MRRDCRVPGRKLDRRQDHAIWSRSLRQERRKLWLRARRARLCDKLGTQARRLAQTAPVFSLLGASRSFWLRTKQGFLAEGLPLLREPRSSLGQDGAATTAQPANLILESNSVLQFVEPSLYFAVIDPTRERFQRLGSGGFGSCDALVLRGAADESALPSEPQWTCAASSIAAPGAFRSSIGGRPAAPALQVLVRRTWKVPADVKVITPRSVTGRVLRR